MFAVIKTGGKQYRVAAEDVITIEKLPAQAGEVVAFDHVLMVVSDGSTEVGTPTVAGATVAGEVLEQTRSKKSISFVKRRRQNSKRKKGHRQELTVVRITDILTGGAKPDMTTAKARPVRVAAAPREGSSNLSLIAGIGPTLEKKLRAAGVESWEQIAAWTPEDVTRLDKELALRGRVVREEWIEQAQELLDGKPPRAKADQAELASGKDL
jgi:large subunit ribosomal protein L21